MDVIKPYVGNYSNAKLASDEIDLDTILAACDEIDLKAGELSVEIESFFNTGSTLSNNVLSIDGSSMIGAVSDCCDDMNKLKNSILDFTAQIREAAVSRYNEIQLQHNEYAISVNERRTRNG